MAEECVGEEAGSARKSAARYTVVRAVLQMAVCNPVQGGDLHVRLVILASYSISVPAESRLGFPVLMPPKRLDTVRPAVHSVGMFLLAVTFGFQSIESREKGSGGGWSHALAYALLLARAGEFCFCPYCQRDESGRWRLLQRGAGLWRLCSHRQEAFPLTLAGGAIVLLKPRDLDGPTRLATGSHYQHGIGWPHE